MNLANEYMNEEFNYGGEVWPWWKIQEDLERKGAKQRQIEMYRIGLEARKGLVVE